MDHTPALLKVPQCEAGFYTRSSDPDGSHVEQTVFMLRYVNASSNDPAAAYEIEERFVRFGVTHDKSAKGLLALYSPCGPHTLCLLLNDTVDSTICGSIFFFFLRSIHAGHMPGLGWRLWFVLLGLMRGTPYLHGFIHLLRGCCEGLSRERIETLYVASLGPRMRLVCRSPSIFEQPTPPDSISSTLAPLIVLLHES
ncbi:hypothetical protein FOZ63_005852 [Perkinsus olseni]|uniref:Uncharacterized protein n=1 Tax=Perkinsus olseni TaxID=32597 RepID=A0A7J6N853_PEROL|nr:hypothetical protein FOZ60_014110 [Perkinsus olseni]KAF4735282.1 hypothetical protein FOZ62_005271 [Perkinsus olseni]KAF4756014.1 hypothetical protein FOZ63_005852 [Perkinsus olseni]